MNLDRFSITHEQVEKLLSLDAVRVASTCLQRLKVLGFDVCAQNDVDRVAELQDEIGKQYLTAPMSPSQSSFTRANTFWLILTKDGKPVGCVGTRLDDIADEDISQFWMRELGRFFDESSPPIVEASGSVASMLTGKIAYIGDLFIHPSYRGQLKVLPNLFGLLHAMTYLEWRPQASYAFMRSSDVLKGLSIRYGFTYQAPAQKRWQTDPPAGRYNDERLVVLPRSDIRALFCSVLDDELGKVQNKRGASPSVNDG